MSTIEPQSMPRQQFLTVAVNLLNRAFLEAKRTDAKNLYRAVAEGKRVALTNLQMDDKSTVRIDLSLDHSEFDGSLNFGAFRNSLTALLTNLASRLPNADDIPTFGAEGDPDNIIFGVTGVAVEKEVPSVMVLATKPGGREPAIWLRLM